MLIIILLSPIGCVEKLLFSGDLKSDVREMMYLYGCSSLCQCLQICSFWFGANLKNELYIFSSPKISLVFQKLCQVPLKVYPLSRGGRPHAPFPQCWYNTISGGLCGNAILHECGSCCFRSWMSEPVSLPFVGKCSPLIWAHSVPRILMWAPAVLGEFFRLALEPQVLSREW